MALLGSGVACSSKKNDQLAPLSADSWLAELPVAGFGAALVAQVNISPAGESILAVPRALAVTKEDKSEHCDLRFVVCDLRFHGLANRELWNGGHARVRAVRAELLLDEITIQHDLSHQRHAPALYARSQHGGKARQAEGRGSVP